MRGVRQFLPTSFPKDHDLVKSDAEMRHGTPGCPCSACCTRRKAIASHLVLRKRNMPAIAAHSQSATFKDIKRTRTVELSAATVRGVGQALRARLRRFGQAAAVTA